MQVVLFILWLPNKKIIVPVLPERVSDGDCVEIVVVPTVLSTVSVRELTTVT